MSLQDTALPEAGTPAEVGGQTSALPESQADASTEGEQVTDPKPEAEQPKKEKTPEEREIARLRRRVDSLTRRYYQAQSQEGANTQGQPREQTAGQHADDEPLQLSRAELDKLIDKRARALAPEAARVAVRQ